MPRLLVPRSCLPLAFLDLNGISGDLQGNRIFSAKIPSLAATLSPGKDFGEPMVLIAESGVTPCLYAVEQVRPGIYALCRLSAWVTLKDLERLNLESKSHSKLSKLEKVNQPGDKWWHKATIESKGAVSLAKRCKSWPAARFELCLKAPIHQSPLAASPEENFCETRQEEPLAVSDNMMQDILPQGNAQNANEIFNMIRSQYQEALYMSQVRSNSLFGLHDNTDGSRHHWRIMRKDHCLALARSFKVAMFRLLNGVSFRNS